MRVLFLDFDGVVHPQSAADGLNCTRPLSHEVERLGLFRWVPHLEDLLTPHPNIKVVVHSTWRCWYEDEVLVSVLGPMAHRFLGSTPIKGGREMSLALWLDAHWKVGSFCILDDDAEAFNEPLRTHVIACRSEYGISDRATQLQLRAWLSGKVRKA